jgi:hypothetical protein
MMPEAPHIPTTMRARVFFIQFSPFVPSRRSLASRRTPAEIKKGERLESCLSPSLCAMKFYLNKKEARGFKLPGPLLNAQKKPAGGLKPPPPEIIYSL